MKTMIIMSLAACCLLTIALDLTAATMSPLSRRDSIFEAQSLAPLQIGAGVEAIKRDFSFDGNRRELEWRGYTGYIGCDVMPWATIFGTVGAVESAWPGADFSSAGLAWSLGANLALWHMDIMKPDFMSGRLRLALTGEYARKKDGGTADGVDTQWTEYFGALLVGYEIYTTTRQDIHNMPYSLMLFVAPCISHIDGTMKTRGLTDQDFEDHGRVGVLGGIEVYIAKNLSVGAQVQHIGRPGLSGSLRYKF
ncbi:MAG: hypothetical protein ABR497_10960 [Kiritimatiellia bacterium]